jgi:cytochrome P450
MTIRPVPFLPGVPFIGNLLDFKRDRLALYRRIYEECGDLGGYTLFSKPFVVLAEAEITRQVLIEKHSDFERSPVMLMMKPILGEGLLTTDNAANSRQRQWINPAFQVERFPQYAQIIVEQTVAFQQRVLFEAETVNLSQAMQRLTLAIIGKTLFSLDILDEVPEFVQIVTDLLHATDQRLKFLLPLPLSWSLPGSFKLNATLQPLHAILNRLIRDRRARSDEWDDLLSLLLRVRDEETGQPLTERQIREQILTFLFAGHETTANTLSWAFYRLARHPSAAARLQDELESLLPGRYPTYDDLKRLPYTAQVIKETLRLYPPAYAFGRMALRDVRLGQYAIRKGTVVLACPYVLHRRADYFANPEEFDPDRFLPEREAAIPRFAYLPFGAGPRACIGRQFAFMEACLILAVLARHHRFTLPDGRIIRPEPMITLRPAVDVHVIIAQVAASYGRPLGEGNGLFDAGAGSSGACRLQRLK